MEWALFAEARGASLQESVAEEEAPEENVEEAELGPQPLGQLITAFSRAATIEAPEYLRNDLLYISYANIMSQVSLCKYIDNLEYQIDID